MSKCLSNILRSPLRCQKNCRENDYSLPISWNSNRQVLFKNVLLESLSRSQFFWQRNGDLRMLDDGPKIWCQIWIKKPPKPLRTNFRPIPWHRGTPFTLFFFCKSICDVSVQNFFYYDFLSELSDRNIILNIHSTFPDFLAFDLYFLLQEGLGGPG